MRCAALLLLCSTRAFAAPALQSLDITSSSTVPVIFDNDGNYDDMLALLYLALAPVLSIKAITMCGIGFGTPHGGPINIAAVAALAGIGDIPIAYGPPFGLSDISSFPLKWRVEMDAWVESLKYEQRLVHGVNATILPQATPRSMYDSPQLITKTLRESPTAVAIIVTGPLTNVALALQKDPSLLVRISALFVMGSNYGASIGNVYDWQIRFGTQLSGCIEVAGQLPVENAICDVEMQGDSHECASPTATGRAGCRGVNMTEVGDTEWNVFLDAKAWDTVALAVSEHSDVRMYVLSSLATLDMPITQQDIDEHAKAFANRINPASASVVTVFLRELAQSFTAAGEAKWWDAQVAVMAAEVLTGLKPRLESSQSPVASAISRGNFEQARALLRVSPSPSVCSYWVHTDSFGVSLEWRSTVSPPSREPYGKVADVESGRGPAGDFCVFGNVTRMAELYWDPPALGESVAEPAHFLRPL
mmetsp:Transcript_1918/g.5433  ORF Transcript_1918/g.5433 Transcript_1918/m.5433 type:complete len:476 (-) Transcript_1918:209-1636(-)